MANEVESKSLQISFSLPVSVIILLDDKAMGAGFGKVEDYLRHEAGRIVGVELELAKKGKKPADSALTPEQKRELASWKGKASRAIENLPLETARADRKNKQYPSDANKKLAQEAGQRQLAADKAFKSATTVEQYKAIVDLYGKK